MAFKAGGDTNLMNVPDLTAVYTSLPYDLKVGSVVKGVSNDLGEADFILLKGAASMGVADVVTYNSYTGAVERSPAANIAAPVAVSMAANTSTSNYSFYQITGHAVAEVGSASAGSKLWHNTAGALQVSAANGKQIVGATCVTANNVTIDGAAIGSGNAVISLARGALMQGQIT